MAKELAELAGLTAPLRGERKSAQPSTKLMIAVHLLRVMSFQSACTAALR